MLDTNYKNIVVNMLIIFKNWRSRMSLEVDFVKSHLDCFSKDFETISRVPEERYHQSIKKAEIVLKQDGTFIMALEEC